MTFIKYTNDGKAVIQPAALTLSNLDNEDALEMYTLDNAIVLLKPEMHPVKCLSAMASLAHLVNYLGASLISGRQKHESATAANEDDYDEDIVAVPAEAFEDAGILHDDLRAYSTEGAVLIVSENRKMIPVPPELRKELKRYGINQEGLDRLMKAVMEFDEDDA
jgi:hypothetical protein